MRSPLLFVTGLAGGLLLSGLGLACDSDSECQRGTEGCFCTANYGCLSGLTCLSLHCVDPNWTPQDNVAGSGGSEDDDDASPSQSDDDDAGGSNDSNGDGATAPDNVGACEGWLESAECGDYDYAQSVNCSAYANVACDISEYFNCLNENTACSDGIPDTSGWAACAELATCS